MQALIGFLAKLLEQRAPIQTLDLSGFSAKEFEGKQMLGLIATSGINSIKKLILADLPIWI